MVTNIMINLKTSLEVVIDGCKANNNNDQNKNTNTYKEKECVIKKW